MTAKTPIMAEQIHTDVLIIGGGFGGMNAAFHFDRLLKCKLKVTVTLISRINFYPFTPLLAEIAASLLEPRHAVNPIRRVLTRVRFIEGIVDRLDPTRREMAFVDENGHRRTISYTHCILAAGSVTEFFGIAGLREHALTLKTLGDAIRIRNHVIQMLERADILPSERRRPLLTFAVVGGGLNGTEVAGELHDFVMRALKHYPNLSRNEVRMVLIERLPHLAQELPETLGDYCRRNLESRGLEVWLKTSVVGYTDGVLSTQEGRQLEAQTVIWSAGVRPSPLIAQIKVESAGGDHRLPTNTFLQVQGFTDLWAVGDLACIPNPDHHQSSGKDQPCFPPTAQHATREGRHAAQNIHAALTGQPLESFRYASRGMLATLGQHRGVGQVKGIRLTGFMAWLAWRAYYLFALPRWERRLRVAFDWTLDLLFPPDIVQLKVDPLEVQSRPASVDQTSQAGGEQAGSKQAGGDRVQGRTS